jgi:hypothetical protein
MSARHSVRCTKPAAGCSQDETNSREKKAQRWTDLIPSCMAVERAKNEGVARSGQPPHWNGAFLSRGSDRTRKYRTI